MRTSPSTPAGNGASIATVVAASRDATSASGCGGQTTKPRAASPVLTRPQASATPGRPSAPAAARSARCEDLGPEALVARGIRRAQADMAEARDAGVARREMPATAVVGPDDEIDAVAARVAEVEHRADTALLAGLGASDAHRDAGIAE